LPSVVLPSPRLIVTHKSFLNTTNVEEAKDYR
jgi:hypothetical protein